MNGLSDFEPDEHALARKPRPFGWFLAGIGALTTLGITFGYYMPLSSAHETLITEHESLAKKTAELDHALKENQKSLKDTDSRRGSLRRFVDEGAQEKETRRAALALAQATAENELEKFLSAKLVDVQIDSRGLVFSFSDALLFRGATSSTSPRAADPLCKTVSGLSGQKDWVVRSIARAPQSDRKYWATAGERAANLSLLLETRCKIAQERIIASSEGLGQASQSEGKTTIVIGPAAPPQLDFDKISKSSGKTESE